MSRLPTMTESNNPKKRTVFDMARARVDKEMTGIGNAWRLVEQTHSYDGGQMDLFPQELIKISSLFIPKVRG